MSLEERTYWTLLYLTDNASGTEEVVGYFDNCRDARRWLNRNAQKKYDPKIYDRYERFIYRNGRKLNYSFMEWSVSTSDKNKGLYKGKIIPKLL